MTEDTFIHIATALGHGNMRTKCGKFRTQFTSNNGDGETLIVYRNDQFLFISQGKKLEGDIPHSARIFKTILNLFKDGDESIITTTIRKQQVCSII